MGKNLKVGDPVIVLDEGLLAIQKFAPPGAKPNNEGVVAQIQKDGMILVEFPIEDDDPEEHSQVSPYPASKVFPKDKKSPISPARIGQYCSADRSNDSIFDRIWKFYYDDKRDIALTDQEERIRQRWEFAWQMLCGINTKRQVAKMVSKRFNISVRHCWEDIKNAILLFGSDPRDANKQAKRELVSQYILMGLKRTWKSGDMENYSRLMIRYNKLHGLEDHSDKGIGDLLEKLKPHVIEFNADPETLEKQAAELMQDVEDTTFEDVTNKDED